MACGGDVFVRSKVLGMFFSLVGFSTGTGGWCSRRGLQGGNAQGIFGMSKLAIPRRHALDPPAVGRTFGVRKQVSEPSTSSCQRGFGPGWTDLGYAHGITMGRALRTGQQDGELMQKKAGNCPIFGFFPHFYRNSPMLYSDLARKEGCMTWKRLIFSVEQRE